MAVKKNTFKGSQIMDINEPNSHFICNDTVNLKYEVPRTILLGPDGTYVSREDEGIATNKFVVSEYISPTWNKVYIDMTMDTDDNMYQANIELHGLDKSGLTQKIAEREFIKSEVGSKSINFDLLGSACTSGVATTDTKGAIENTISVDMPLLAEDYQDVYIQPLWMSSSWKKRKGIPFSDTLNYTKNAAKYNATSGIAKMEALVSHSEEVWNGTIKVTYDSDMNADFSDLRFTGPDGITEIPYWIFDKSNSNYAYIMLVIPWYYGYKEPYECDYNASTSGIYTGNSNPSYIWMYYGNPDATTLSDSTLGGYSLYYTDFPTGSVNKVKDNVAFGCGGTAEKGLTTGFTAYSNGAGTTAPSIAAANGEFYRGLAAKDTYALRCNTPGEATQEGVTFLLRDLTNGQSHTIQFDVLAPLGVTMRGTCTDGTVDFTGTGDWQTVTLTFTAGSTSRTFQVSTYNATTFQQTQFYLDSVICIEGSAINDTHYNSDDGQVLCWTPWYSSGTGATAYTKESGGYLDLYCPASTVIDTTVFKPLTDVMGHNFDIILKVSEFTGTAGNYDWDVGMVYDSNNWFYINFSDSQYRCRYTKAGVTSYTTYVNHNDTAPLYFKISVSPKGTSPAITISVSENGQLWDHFVTLYGNSVDLISDFTTQWMLVTRRGAWAALPAFTTRHKIDWVQIIPSMKSQHRYIEYNNTWHRGDFFYDWNGDNYSAGAKYWAQSDALDYLPFTITNGTAASWTGGTYNCPQIYRGSIPAAEDDSYIFEVRISEHARTTGANSYAGISLRIDNTNSFNIWHQRSSTTSLDGTIGGKAIWGSVDYTKGSSFVKQTPSTSTPVYLRIVKDAIKKMVYQDYSFDGINWIRHGTDSWNSFRTATKVGVFLANDGTAACTSKVDYARVTNGAQLAGRGDVFTAEQSYTDFPIGATGYNNDWTDDFDGISYIVDNMLTANQALGTDVSHNTTGFTAIGTGTITSDATQFYSGTDSIKCVAAAKYDGFYTTAVTGLPNTLYTVQGYVKGTAGEQVLVGMRYFSRGSIIGGTLVLKTLTGGWDKVTFTYVTPATLDQISYLVYSYNAGAQTFYMDEMILYEGASIPPYSYLDLTTGDLMGSSVYSSPKTYTSQNTAQLSETYTQALGAEIFSANVQDGTDTLSATTGFTGANAAIASSTTVKQAGSRSLRINPSGASTDSYAVIGTDSGGGSLNGMSTGKWYTCKGYIYVPAATAFTSADRSMRIVGFYKDSGGNYREQWSTKPIQKDTWTELECSMYIPTGATEAFFRLYNGTNVAGAYCYWDTLTLKEGSRVYSGTKAYRCKGDATDNKANATIFSDVTENYEASFYWKPLTGHGSGTSTNHFLWFARYLDSSNNVRIDTEASGTNVVVRLVQRVAGTDTVLSSVTWLATGSANTPIPVKPYYVQIKEDNKMITVKIDNVTLMRYAYTSTAMPARYKGFGCNQYAGALWDSISLTDLEDYPNRFTFLTGSSWVRGMPAKIYYKEYGTDYQQSRKFNARNQSLISLGPNGLDKYIGMKTIFKIKSDYTQNWTINNVTYEWEY